RFFQKNSYIAVDYLTKKVEVVKIKEVTNTTDDTALLLTNAEGVKKQLYFENPTIEDSNAIQKELEHFATCIQQNKTPRVSLQDGVKALDLAHQIIEKMKKFP
ncbi:MAG: gfo/Idh/MocA family oxidoreductase, partial [Flavobacteriaceae bacterium]